MQENSLSGGLPSEWANNSSWNSLKFLNLGQNQLGGELPYQWGENGAFNALRILYVYIQNIFIVVLIQFLLNRHR